jgi:hypothetical protein
MIAPLLLLTLLSTGFVIFWIAWWLAADLFSSWAPPAPARIEAVDEKPRYTVGIKRTVIGH